MSDIRNPMYPNGMTMAELIAHSDAGRCYFCSRWGEPLTDATHDGMCAVPFMREAQAKLEAMGRAKLLARQQAKDEGLWFLSVTAPEAYLQQALRHLHAVIEEE